MAAGAEKTWNESHRFKSSLIVCGSFILFLHFIRRFYYAKGHTKRITHIRILKR